MGAEGTACGCHNPSAVTRLGRLESPSVLTDKSPAAAEPGLPGVSSAMPEYSQCDGEQANRSCRWLLVQVGRRHSGLISLD